MHDQPMSRRAFGQVLATTLVAASRMAIAQSRSAVRRIGILDVGVPATADEIREAGEPFRKLGWVEGENLFVERRYAGGRQRHLDKLNAPVIVAYGTLETPEFQRQSREFAAAVKVVGKPVQLLVGGEYNHFEIIETLANPYGLLGRAVSEQMNLRYV
jgi:hypothetical protein